ncbi:ROM3 [Symbiodinium sp. KB8]|nr:ROM3 [Symbiodinium sp. KB8]
MFGSVQLRPPEPDDVSFTGRVQGATAALGELWNDSVDGVLWLLGSGRAPIAECGAAALWLPAMMEPCTASTGLCLSSAAIPLAIGEVPPPRNEMRMQRQAKPGILQTLFPGCSANSMLVVLSIAEVAAFGALCLITPSAVGWILSPCTLHSWGAAFAPQIAHGELWRLLAPIFLHANWGHVLSNVVFQLRVGFLVERMLGESRFALLYLGSGVIGTLISAAVVPGRMSVGASTCALGLLGASMAKYHLGESTSSQSQSMATSTPLILLMVNVAPEADAARCKGLGFRVYRSFNFQGRVDKKFDAPSCGVLRMKKIHTSNFQGLEP